MTERATPAPRRLTRRSFLQIVAVAGAVGAGYQFGLLNGTSALQSARRSQPIMGTYVNLTVYGRDRDQCEAAIDRTLATMTRLEAVMSRHMPDSPVARLNRQGAIADPDPALLAVLQQSRHLNEITEGGFDITMLPLLALYSTNASPDPDQLATAGSLVNGSKLQFDDSEVRLTGSGMAITLDGIGKGYIVDQAVLTLTAEGFGSVYVDAGGDMMVNGAKPDGSPWRIGIMNPRQDSGKPVTFQVSERAVATSGDYFQAFTPDLLNHHIIDPRTGHSSPELASCTVTAPTVALADGLATAVMVLGRERGLALLESLDGCEGYLFDKSLHTSHTTGFFG